MTELSWSEKLAVVVVGILGAVVACAYFGYEFIRWAIKKPPR